MNAIRNGIVGAVGFVLVAFPTVAFAGFKPSDALFSACRSDAIRLCSTSLMSMDSVAACLKAKKSAASARCQALYDAETKKSARK